MKTSALEDALTSPTACALWSAGKYDALRACADSIWAAAAALELGDLTPLPLAEDAHPGAAAVIRARRLRLQGDWEAALSMADDLAASSPSLAFALRAALLSQRGDPVWLDEAARSLSAPQYPEQAPPSPYPWADDSLWGGLAYVRVSAVAASRLRLSGPASRSGRAYHHPQSAAIIAPALAWLMRALRAAEERQDQDRLLRLSLAQALAMESFGDSLRGMTALERAVRIAERGGARAVFWEEGEPARRMLESLRAAVARQRLPDLRRLGTFLAHVLADFPNFGELSPALSLRPSASPVLTARQREILAHLERGASYAEIAAALYLSLSTVRWHVHALYRALGVSSRARALAQARRHGLL